MALSAIYAFARRIDDISDGDATTPVKSVRLAETRASLGRISIDSNDPVLVALADASQRLPIPLSAFDDLIAGAEMDVSGKTYDTFDQLVVYCRQVAGSIGRLSVGVFEASDMARALPLADDLGVALQLTNILRDVREDHDNGRMYLPREDFERFACELAFDRSPDRQLATLLRFEAERAQAWFDQGLKLMPLLEGRSAACASTLAGIYHRILRRILRRPEVVLERRVSLPMWEKAWIAARSLAGAGA